MTESTGVLAIEGLNDLEIAELKKEFRAAGLDLHEIAEVEQEPLDETKLGDPGTAMLLFELGKIGLPLMAGVIGGWLAKGRARSKKRSIGFAIKKGEVKFNFATSEDLTEAASKEQVQEKLIRLATEALK